MPKVCVMMENPVIADLHTKFEERTWNETFQLVQRCMEKSRDVSKPCEPLVRTLRRLQEVLSTSLNSTMSRLEMIARQLGVGFHRTGATCYLTADLLYVEVLFLPCGEVKDVNVARHGKSPTVSQSLLHLLRSEHFSDFSIHLAALFTQYKIPENNETKLKLMTSLQYLGKDLDQMSHLPWVSECCNFQMDRINGGILGVVIAEKDDSPLTIKFFLPPSNGMRTSESCLEAGVHTAQVTVGASDVSHKLQMASVLRQPPQLDLLGHPVFLSIDEVPHEMFPACFLLRLQPALPMTPYFVEKLGKITAIPQSNLQWAPLPKLLVRAGSQNALSHWEPLDSQEAIFCNGKPPSGGVTHSCVLSEAAWDLPAHRGTMVDRVPFTSPAHVAAVLEVLRHQCVINTLLRSCFTAQASREGSACDRPFEVLPESDVSFSSTFQLPNKDSLAVLLVNVCNPYQITCRLYGAGASDSSIDGYISNVLKSGMSIPDTMGILYGALQDITPAPLTPSRPVATQAETERAAPPSAAVTDTSRGPGTFPRGAAVPTDNYTVSVSGFTVPAARFDRFPEICKALLSKPFPLRRCVPAPQNKRK